MIRALLVSISLVLALSGCSSMPNTQPVIEEQQTIVLQQDLLKYCPPLKQLQVKSYSQAESFEAVKQWAIQYKECQIKHKALADLLQNLNRS